MKIKPECDNITIRHNEIYNSGRDLSRNECNAEGIDNVNADNMKVQNNYIHNICSTGVYFKGGSIGNLVENNYIENVGAMGVGVGFDTSPEFFDLTVNPDYYESIDGIVRHNLIKDADWAGIGIYASQSPEVYNNTIIDSSSVYYSPIYFGLTFQDWDSTAKRPATVNPKIYNNIVSQKANLDHPVISIRHSDELGGLDALHGQVDMHDNCYYRADHAVSFEDGQTQVDQGGWLDNWTGDFTAWKNHMNTDFNSIEANPQFNNKYQPQNSACIKKGY